MKNSIKTLIFFLSLITIIFIIPYFIRESVSEDIRKHSKFGICEIIRKTGSLKNGEHWHYRFRYKGKIFENYKPSFNAYDVKIGESFLVNFSSINPNHSEILYKYKLKNGKEIYSDSIWDKIPEDILVSGFKIEYQR